MATYRFTKLSFLHLYDDFFINQKKKIERFYSGQCCCEAVPGCRLEVGRLWKRRHAVQAVPELKKQTSRNYRKNIEILMISYE